VDQTTETQRFSARELAELAGTTVRTIHYYTTENLLPSPEGSTRGATYGRAHLARLRLIAALRDEGMALSKIRERLAPLTDAQAVHVAEMLQEYLAVDAAGQLSAVGLIDLELSRQTRDALEADDTAFTPLTIPLEAPAAFAIPPQPVGSAHDYLDRLRREEEQLRQPPARNKRVPWKPAPAPPQFQSEPAEVWYHYRLEDGIELRLREDRYRQLKGRPAALIDSIRAYLHRGGPLRAATSWKDDLPPE